MTPVYLVAKYVQDVFRMEPINIGVILWSNGRAASRFLGVSLHNGMIEVNGSRLRNWCNSREAYEQWIEYWMEKMAQAATVSDGKGFIDEMTITNRNAGNYWMVEGGILLDELEPDNLESAVDELFGQLVPSSEQSPKETSFSKTCTSLLRKSPLWDLEGFHANHSIACKYFGTTEITLEFSYTVANGRPKSVMERVPYFSNESRWAKRVYESAWKMERAVAGCAIHKKNALVLIDNQERYSQSARGKELLKIISHVGKPIDVSNSKFALQEFERIHQEVVAN